MREWRAATAGDAAVDVAPSLALSGRADDPIAELPAIVEGGVPTAKAFMVYDFRLDDRRLFEALGAMGRAGGVLAVHCEDPVLIDAGVAAALARGDTRPRDHAVSRTREAEAVATHRALAFAQAADAPIHIVHLSSAPALDEVRRAKAAGVRVSVETCPHYLAFTADRYAGTDAEAIRYVISPPLRTAADRDALWAGLADGTLDLVATDHVPDRLAVEKRLPAPAVPARSATGRRASRRCSLSCTARASRAAGSPWSGWSTCCRRRRRAGSGSPARGRSSPASTPTSCCSTRAPDGRSGPPTCTTRATTRRTRGWRWPAPSAPSSSAAARSCATATFVGERGFGRFVERRITA